MSLHVEVSEAQHMFSLSPLLQLSVHEDVQIRASEHPCGEAAVQSCAGGSGGGEGDCVGVPGENRKNPEGEPESEEEAARAPGEVTIGKQW